MLVEDCISSLSTNLLFSKNYSLQKVIKESTTLPFFEATLPGCANVYPSIEPIHHKDAPPMPDEVSIAYTFMEANVELQCQSWTFMSMNEIVRRTNDTRASNQMRVVPLAFTYAGMGHVNILAYNPIEDHTFTYIDGGASVYNRQKNHECMIQFTKDDICSKRRELVDILFDSSQI